MRTFSINTRKDNHCIKNKKTHKDPEQIKTQEQTSLASGSLKDDIPEIKM